jgi:predicted MFS family arabinose efflux permease
MQSKHQIKFVILLNVINILIITSAGFMMPLWGDFVAKIGGDVRTAGTAIGIFSMVIGIFTVIAGKIESKYDHDARFMVATQVIMTLSYGGYFFVSTPLHLYVVQIGLGLAGAFQAPALYSLYQKYMPDHDTTFYWGMWAGFYNVAIGTGAFISAYIVHHYGFTAMFSTLFSVSAFGLIVAIYTKVRMMRTAL